MDMASHPLPPYTDPAAKQRARWEEMAVHAAEANAFYAPDMLAAAIDHLAADRDVRLIEAHDGERLIGLLPVTIRSRHGRLPIGCVANWIHDHCFFGAPMIARGQEAAAWRSFLTQLDDAPWARGFLHL
ncbi:MAG: CelD-like protein, partial [Sphingobium sp.]|nr:CelD-like protein [Sphingobium sp.]